MEDSLFFLIRTLTDFYLLAFLLRFILQWIKADFYNPLTQAIVKITSPLVNPVRRVVPASKSIDAATLVVLITLEIIVTWVLITLAGLSVSTFPLLLLVLYRLEPNRFLLMLLWLACILYEQNYIHAEKNNYDRNRY